MQKGPPVFVMLLFLEEFIFWVPLTVSTIVERLLQLLLRSANTSTEWIVYLNVGLCAILFFMAVGGATAFLRQSLSNVTSTNLILFMNRHNIIRIVLAALIAVWILWSVRQTLSGDLGTVMDLYLNKPFWAMIFIGVAAYKFVSPGRNE